MNRPVPAYDIASAPDGNTPERFTVLAPGIDVDVMPTSFGQARLWFLDRLSPDSVAYVSDFPLRVRGPFDEAAFEHALGVVVARHEALRTRFAAVEGEPVQVIVPELRIPVERMDLSGNDDPLTSARTLARQVAATRFDLARGPARPGRRRPAGRR